MTFTVIKEAYGDKRTYINNIYLYDNIDLICTGKNCTNTIDTIKEEDDSSSVFFLRESRERTLPRKKNVSNNTNLSIFCWNAQYYSYIITLITTNKSIKVQNSKLNNLNHKKDPQNSSNLNFITTQ